MQICQVTELSYATMSFNENFYFQYLNVNLNFWLYLFVLYLYLLYSSASIKNGPDALRTISKNNVK